MSVVWRMLSVAALVVSAGILIVSIVTVRREQRVRTGLDLLRLGITLGTTLLMASLLGVDTSEAYMGLGFLAGLLLGVYEGLHLRLRFLGKATFTRRTALGVAAWGLGVVAVQGAGVIGRIGLADFGLSLSFFGIGQVVGLLTGRWQTTVATRHAAVGAGAAVLVVLALAGALLPGLGAGAQEAVDLRAVMAGQVDGLRVEVRGNSQFYGPALSLGFANDTGAEVVVAVPLGLQFLPANEAAQTMVAAGAEMITVPVTGPDQWYPVDIQAFCAQYHDGIPNRDDFFSAGDLVTGDLGALIGLIHEGGVYGYDQQRAIWALTDALDASDYPAAVDLVAAVTGEAGSGSLPTLPDEEGQESEGTTGGVEGVLPVAAVDDDPENGLWDCASNPAHRVGFGDPSEDRVRCFTFRYDVPARGIESAVVYLAIEAPTGSLQDTDSVAMAVGEPFPEQCDLAGEMPGCVTLHGGFAGGERSLTVDLLDLSCEAERKAARRQGAGEMQAAVRAQLETGVVHMILQDDTMLLGARLALNEGEALLPCGTSDTEAPLTGTLPSGPGELEPGEGTRTSVAGLGGAAALLLTALAGSGNTLGAAASAFRRGGTGALRDLLRGGSGGGQPAPWLEPQAALSGGRAGAALLQVPEDLRARVQEALSGRLETEQAEGFIDAVRKVMGPVDLGAEPAAVLGANPRAEGLLGQLPEEVRRRLRDKLLAGMEEERVAGAVEEAARALRRDRAVDLIREAIVQRDGSTVQRVLGALGPEDAARVWPRAAAGLQFSASDLEYPPPAPGAGGGAGAPPPLLEGFRDADLDLSGAVPPGGEAEGVLAHLPGGLRSQVEARLMDKLEAGRVSRWVEKLREAGGGSGALLDSADARHLLDLLPPGIRERVAAAASHLADGEAVQGLAGTAHHLLQESRGVELLQAAMGARDGDGADAVLEALGAALDVAGKPELERIAREATPQGTAGLAALPRHGGAVVPVDLTEHLASEADLLGAARRAAGVEELLQRAGSLRPEVEAALVGRLEEERVGRAVARAAPAVPGGAGPAEAADLPEIQEVLALLPEASRRVAYRRLVERLEAQRLEAAVGHVGRALGLDRAEAALRRAVAAGDLDAADRALAGLSAEEARAVGAAAFGT